MNDFRIPKFGPRWYHVCLGMMVVGLLVLEMFVFFLLVGWLLSMVTALIILLMVPLVRHRFPFSLRKLLMFVLLAGIPLGLLLGTKVQRLRNERNVVAEIQRMGGNVTFGVVGDPAGFLPVSGIPAHDDFRSRLKDSTASDRWLRTRLGADPFPANWVRLQNTAFTDADMATLESLSDLEFLTLHNTEITDAGLDHLKGLTNLQWLNLIGTQVTDAGVKKLQEALPNCNIEH